MNDWLYPYAYHVLYLEYEHLEFVYLSKLVGKYPSPMEYLGCKDPFITKGFEHSAVFVVFGLVLGLTWL